MDKKWRKAIFQLLPLDGRYFLAVALNQTKQNYNNNKKKKRREKKRKKEEEEGSLSRIESGTSSSLWQFLTW